MIDFLRMDSETAVYSVSFYFRGRRITESSEPPTNLIDGFLDVLASGLFHPGWDHENDTFLEHSCGDDCAIETCIVFGRPYTKSVRESFAA